MLELLQSASFRALLKNEGFAAELQKKQLAHWAHWRTGAPVKMEAAESTPKDGAPTPAVAAI